MGLFSRKSSKPAEQATEAAPVAEELPQQSPVADEPVIDMPISITTIPAAASRPSTAPAAAPSATPTTPAAGLTDEEAAAAASPLVHNTIVEAALERWGARKDAQTMFNVLRQCATGTLLLDLHGSEFTDPAKPFGPGDTVRIASQTDNDGKRLLFAFTSNAEISKLHNGEPPISFVQPAPAILKQAVTDFDGLVINPGSPETMCIAYEAEISQGLTKNPELNEPLKRTLLEQKTPWPQFIDMLATTDVVFIATKETRDESGELVGVSMPTIDGGDGKTLAAAFTSPAEVWAWAPGVDARATRISNIARASLNDGHVGVVINPAGEGVLLKVADLEKLAQESAAQA